MILSPLSVPGCDFQRKIELLCGDIGHGAPSEAGELERTPFARQIRQQARYFQEAGNRLMLEATPSNSWKQGLAGIEDGSWGCRLVRAWRPA